MHYGLYHLQVILISLKFLLQMAPDIREILGNIWKVLDLDAFQLRNKKQALSVRFLCISCFFSRIQLHAL